MGTWKAFLAGHKPPAARRIGTASLRHQLEEEEAVTVAVCAVGQPWPFSVRAVKEQRCSVYFLVLYTREVAQLRRSLCFVERAVRASDSAPSRSASAAC